MTNKQLQQFDTTGLEKIEITEGINGYPEGLGHFGLIGFENFEAAKIFAAENDLEVVGFYKRDGWQFWENQGNAYATFTADNYLDAMGDNYNFADTDHEWYKEQLTELVDNFDGDFTAIEEKIKYIKEILHEVDNAGDDAKVIVSNGIYIETIDNELMSYHHDVHNYCIGVY